MVAGGLLDAAAGQALPLLIEFLDTPSVEVAPGRPEVVDALRAGFDPGTEVFINHPPKGDDRAVAETAKNLRRGGFVPVPHVVVRNFADANALRDFLARVTGGADVSRVLVVAGDRPKPAGPFAASMDAIRTGAFAEAGIRAIGIAAHPEGHPAVPAATLDAALIEKVAAIAAAGQQAFIVTQFAFEAEPVLARLRRIRAAGVTVPVRIGIAGPASIATLIRFAVRCGIGNSLRTLRQRTNTVGRLLGDSRPEEILRDLGAGLAAWPDSGVSGFHFFPFGGIEQTGSFIAETLSRLYGEVGRVANGAGG